MIVAAPVLGIGLNNSTAVKKEFEDHVAGEWHHPIHNFYITLAAETGLVGFVLFMGFFGLTAIEAFRRSKSGDLVIASLGVAIFGSYMALAGQLVADGITPDASTMLWFYAGLIMALGRIDQPLIVHGSQGGKGYPVTVNR